MSTESIESIAPSTPGAGAPAACASCGAPLAEDQRYCLQCGERVAPMSSVLLGSPPASAPGAPGPSAPPGAAPPGSAPPHAPGEGGGSGRGNAVTVIAGVGVLLLAMGVGVLIGRAGGSKQNAPAAAQVITVDSGGAGGAAPESFTSDWPAGEGGFTVQLQTLPAASTQASAVQAAKSSAEGKGAKEVGALKSDEFPGLPAGNYVVYAGKYAKRAEAQKALGGLKQSFPGASVIEVGTPGAKASGAGGSGASPSTGSGAGSSPSHPASPKVLEKLKSKHGKSYEEESKNLPNVVGT